MRPLIAVATATPLLIAGVAAAPPAVAVSPASAPAVAVAGVSSDHPRSRKASRAMGAVAMRSHGTRFSPTRAANRLETWAKRGVSGYHNQCLRLADNAYQPRSGRTSTALRQWKRAKARGYANPKDRRPPVGAQMFWRTSNPAGHIATYVGNGKAVTNMPGGKVKKVNWRLMNKWGPYLGWAEPYYR